MSFGSGDNGEFTFLDMISIVSFFIGLQNLELNITQNDLDEQTKALDKRVNEEINFAIADIHEHLQEQDEKINSILEVLKNARNI